MLPGHGGFRPCVTWVSSEPLWDVSLWWEGLLSGCSLDAFCHYHNDLWLARHTQGLQGSNWGLFIALGCAQWSSRISHKGFTDTFLLVNLIWALLFTYGLHFYYIYAFPSRNLYSDTSYYTAITGYCKADLFDLCHGRFVNTEKCLLHLHYRWWKHNRLIGYQLYGIQVGSRRPIFSNAMGIGSTGFGSDLCYSLHWKVQMGSDI